MVRSLFRAPFWYVAAVVLGFCAVPRMAAAQNNTISQTTCGGVNGVGSCVTNGFLQDLAVDCNGGTPAPFVATALAQITDRNGPNRIRVSGTCGLFIIVGFNRLTIEGIGGAKVTQIANIVNSRNVLIKSLTFDQQPGFNLSFNGSQVLVDGVTVKNVSNEAAVALQGSTLGFTGAPSLITENGCIGIDVGAGSHVDVANVTISNNGFQQGCGGQRHGIKAHNGGSVNLSNQINVNGAFVDAPVDISGNRGNGVSIQGGSLSTSAEGGNAWIHIHDNGGVGLELASASTEINGHVRFDGNNNAQIVVFGGSLAIGEGAQVEGVGGITAVFHAFVIIGSGGPMTLSGGVFLGGGSTAMLGEANIIDALTCDATSSVLNADNRSTVGRNACQSGQGLPAITGLTVVTASATTVAAGGTMTFTVINGPGNVLDWVGLFCPSTLANSGYVDWKRMSNTKTPPQTGLTSATITFTAPMTLGSTCNVRVFSNDSLTAVATSATVSVDATTVTPSATTVASGGTMTFTVANGQGNVLDWVGLFCPPTLANADYVDWKRLSNTRTPPPIGLTSATITFTAPSPGSTCNVRVLSNDTFTAVATSATVTVQ